MRIHGKLRFVSEMDKYNTEMRVTRELQAANIEVKKDYPGNNVLIYVCKDFSGYNDRTSVTITLSREDAIRLATSILGGFEDVRDDRADRVQVQDDREGHQG